MSMLPDEDFDGMNPSPEGVRLPAGPPRWCAQYFPWLRCQCGGYLRKMHPGGAMWCSSSKVRSICMTVGTVPVYEYLGIPLLSVQKGRLVGLVSFLFIGRDLNWWVGVDRFFNPLEDTKAYQALGQDEDWPRGWTNASFGCWPSSRYCGHQCDSSSCWDGKEQVEQPPL